MTRLIAVSVALLFARGAVSVPIADAAGTTTKPPAKSGEAQPETKGGAGKPMTKKLDINSASRDDLEQLPGIGNALSKKIIDTRHYKRKDYLASKNVLPRDPDRSSTDQTIARRETTKGSP